MHSPIAYTYDADTHCPDCAETRFGICAAHSQTACCVADSEGNEPGAIFNWDTGDWDNRPARNVLACGTCHDTIEESDPDLPEISKRLMEDFRTGKTGVLTLVSDFHLTASDMETLMERFLEEVTPEDIPEPSAPGWPAKLAAWNHALATNSPHGPAVEKG